MKLGVVDVSANTVQCSSGRTGEQGYAKSTWTFGVGTGGTLNLNSKESRTDEPDGDYFEVGVCLLRPSWQVDRRGHQADEIVGAGARGVW